MAKEDYARFVERANPHAWLLTADRLHEQALILREKAPDSRLSHADPVAGTTTWDTGNKACFLLAGFAVENAIKAFLVHENPSWIQNGKLSKKLLTSPDRPSGHG